MKIKSYQSGGIVYLPTSNRTEAPTTGASASDAKSKVPEFAKEIISIVKEKGLDNDVNAMLNQVESLLNEAADPTGASLDMHDILKVVRKASNVATDYEKYKKAEASLESEEAFGEVATTKTGQLYVQDASGNIKTVSGKEYSENKDKYLALTNGDVLNLRRYNPNFTFATNVLDDLSEAAGMKSVITQVNAIIDKLGKSTSTGYATKKEQNILEGLQHIVAGDVGSINSLLAAGP